MAIRLEQMHPALVHFPLALFPLAVAADLLATVIGSKAGHSFGRKAIAAAAVGAAGAVVTGLIAGEEVNVEGRSRDQLMTHRNLNVLAAIVASGMAVWRSRNARPNAAYLGAGVVGVGVLGYTAYLGGQLVYDSGVGVGPAKGVYRPEDAPTLKPGRVAEFAATARTDLLHGVQHMTQELAQGYVVPAIAGKHMAPAVEGVPANGTAAMSIAPNGQDAAIHVTPDSSDQPEATSTGSPHRPGS